MKDIEWKCPYCNKKLTRIELPESLNTLYQCCDCGLAWIISNVHELTPDENGNYGLEKSDSELWDYRMKG